ncbi:MAG: hypothetical protein AABW53_01625 [Nanoarchaeota archaeon]
MKKSWWLFALTLGIPAVYAGPLDVLEGAWQKFLSVGSLSFIGISGTVPFTRILIWILSFTLFFAVITGLGAAQQKPFGFFKRSQAIVVAAVLATISAIFLPASAILAVGAGWATAVGLLLIGGPIFGFWYLIWKWPGKDQETKMTVIIKLILSMILFWILIAMANQLLLAAATDSSPPVIVTMGIFISWALFIVSLMIIWYIVKIFWVTTPEEKAKQEQEWGEKGAAVRGKLKEWAGKKEAEEQMDRKKDLTSPVKDYVIKAMSGLSEVEDSLNDLKGDKARKKIDEVQDNLRKAVRSCKLLLRNLEAGDREAVLKIINFLQAAQKEFLGDVKDKIPANINSRADIKAILDNFETLRGSLGNVFKQLEMLHSKK